MLKPTKQLVLLSCAVYWVCIVDGYMFQNVVDCEYSRDDLSDMIYSVKLIFNQKLLCYYDSRLGKYTGYGEFGISNAERFNQQKGKIEGRKAELETTCKFSARFYENTTKRKVPPSVRVKAPVESRYGTRTMVECGVRDFYPQDIRVTWLKDGSEVTEGVSSTDSLANGDWYYQVHSYLELVPRRGEKVSCKVEHSSQPEPLEVPWDTSALDTRVYKKALGLSSFLLGLTVAAAGGLYYYWKTNSAFTALVRKWTRVSPTDG